MYINSYMNDGMHSYCNTCMYIHMWMIVCIHVWIKGYLSNAVTFDASVWFKQLRLCRFDLRFDFFSVSKGIRLVCSVQLVLGTLADGAVICAAHSGGCNLQAVHAEQVPEATTQAHPSVSKSKILILRAQSVDLGYDRVHTAVVQLQAPVPLPFNVVVGKRSWLQDWQESKRSPCVGARHDSAVVIETPHCTQTISVLCIQWFVVYELIYESNVFIYLICSIWIHICIHICFHTYMNSYMNTYILNSYMNTWIEFVYECIYIYNKLAGWEFLAWWRSHRCTRQWRSAPSQLLHAIGPAEMKWNHSRDLQGSCHHCIIWIHIWIACII